MIPIQNEITGVRNGTRFDRPSCRQPLFDACVKSEGEQLKVGHWVGGEKGAMEEGREGEENITGAK